MVRVFTPQPRAVLDAIYQAINDGTVTTWQSTEQGSLTHAPSQWRNLAWFRPRLDPNTPNVLVFSIIRPRDGRISKEAYAVYHGRFSEMLLAHFDEQLNRIELSSLPVTGDLV